MKKLFLLTLAFVASLTAMAQDNLARIEGTEATASGYEGAFVPANVIDGNAGTRWGSYYEGNTDAEWLQIEWTSAQTFNTVKLLCEGAMSAGNAPQLAFDIQTSNDGANWTTQVEVTGKNAGNNEYITVNFDVVTAKFVRFQGVKKGTWGYSFYEFEVYNIDYSSQTLGKLTLPNPDKADALKTAMKVGESITIQAFDQNNVVMESGFEFSATNGTITAAGVFTPSAKGVCTITAKQGDVTKTATVYAYEGENLLVGKNATYNPEATNVNLFTNGNWGDRGGLGSPADGHTWIYYDLMAYYTIDLVDLKQEQACGKNYSIQFSADGETWTDAYVVTDEAGMAGDVRHYFFGSNDNTNVRFVRFDCTEPATGYGVSIYEFAAYGVKTADVEDTEAPTAFTASLQSVAFTTATLKLKATDNVSSITYVISRDGADDVEINGPSGEEISAVVNGLTPATAYTFSVVAKDAKGNATAALTVNATTAAWTAAPTPTEDADNVYALFSDAYSDTHDFSYRVWWDGQAKQEEIEPTSGDKVWHISDFVFIGSEHAKVDASGFLKLHMDVMPVGDNLTLAVTPVNADENANIYVNTLELTANQWNAVDINISDFITAGLTMTNAFQIKLTGANGQNGTGQEFYLDNIYYVKAAGEKTIYLNPNIWDVADATEAYAAYVFNEEGNEWIDMTPVEDTNYFTATIPTSYTGLILTRRNAGSEMNWDNNNIWNQTVDIDFTQVADNTLFTITAWHENGEEGNSLYETSTYVAPTTYTAMFKNSIGWDEVYAYAYTEGEPVKEYLGAWPGTKLTDVEGTLTISFKATEAPANIIFNNGETGDGKQQTEDLVFEDGKEYDMVAPVEHNGTEYTVNDHTIWVQAINYVATNTYEVIITSEEEMTGLGGSFWELSTGNADLREHIEVSADKHTITITATSTTDPRLYTPLYILTPGEVSFSDVVFDWIRIDAEGNIVVPATISNYQWATFSSDKALDFTNVADVKAYIVTGAEGSTLTTQQVEGAVAANTGLVLFSETADTYYIPVAEEGTSYASTNKLVAVTEDTEVGKANDGTNYVLTVQGDKVVFAYIDAISAQLKKGQSYLHLDIVEGETPAPFLGFDGTGTTGINSVERGALSVEGCYTLDGRRVAQPTKGLYIVNGKKVLVK